MTTTRYGTNGRTTQARPARLRMPPWDEGAERALLGSVLLEPAMLDAVRPVIEGKMFYDPAHRIYWETVEGMVRSCTAIDFPTFRDALVQGGHVPDQDAMRAIVSLTESVPSSANARYYADIVNRMYRLRQGIVAAEKLAASCYDAGNDPKSNAVAVESILEELKEDAHVPGYRSGVEVVEEFRTKRTSGWRGALATGYPSLDKFGGVPRGELTVVGARTSVGKTTFMLNVAVRMARCGFRVAFLSLEMTLDQLAAKLIAQTTGYIEEQIRAGSTLPEIEDEAYQRSREQLSLLGDSLLLQGGSCDVDVLVAKARQAERRGTDAVFVDYLQCTTGRHHRSQYESVTDYCKSWKELAESTGMAVVLGSQVSRGESGERHKKPKLSMLRDSGAIEEKAGVVWLLHRPHQHKDEADPTPDTTLQIGVAKNRLGRTGELELRFVPETAQVSDLHDGIEGAPF